MNSRCPKCHHAIDVSRGDSSTVICSCCGQSVHLTGLDETVDTASPGSSAAADDLEQVERLLMRFEEAWRLGLQPRVAEYLTIPGAHRLALLTELIHLDLAYRFQANLSPTLETYLAEFPELNTQPDAVLELLVAEFRLRRDHHQSPSLDDFQQRFPTYRDQLTKLLRDPPRSRQRRFPIRLNCPHCRQPIALVDVGEDDVNCPSCGESFAVDGDKTQSWSGPTLPKVGRFQLLRDVGHGSFGTVYCARDEELQRIVAIKIPRSGTFSTQADEDRFIREARNAAQLDHPGIVRVLDAGRTGEFPYIVTEFVRGVTLASLLTVRRLDVPESVRLAIEIADALEHAHRHGVVHRDLKPANIMVDTAGRPRLMDFGLAKRDMTEVTVSIDGRILGTPAYMPPEQARGDARLADQRSDVYSLGVVLFELLTGERPFRGDSVVLLQHVINTEPPPLRNLNNKLPRDLETLVAKCLEKPPPRRYQSAAELAADLRRYLNHEPITARPISRWERAVRWCQRNPLLVRSTAAVVAILVVSLIVVSLSWRNEWAARGAADRTARHNAELANERQRLLEQERAARQRATRYFAETRVPTVPDDLLRFYPEVGAYHAQVLEREADQFERLVRDAPSDDADFQIERAQTYTRLGGIRFQLGELAAARTAYAEAIRILQAQDALAPHQATCRQALGIARHQLARLLQHAQDLDSAKLECQAAIDDLTAASSADSADASCWLALASARRQLATLTGIEDLAAAIALLRQSLTDVGAAKRLDPHATDVWRTFGESTAQLAGLLARQGDFAQALDVVQDGLRQLDELSLARSLDTAALIVSREQARVYLAAVLRSRGEYQQELAIYDQVIAEYEALERAVPDSSFVSENLALTRVDLAQALLQLGQTTRAESIARQAQDAYAAIFSAHAEPRHLEGLAAASATLAETLLDLGRPADAEPLLRGSIQALQRLEQQFPHIVPYLHRRAACHSLWGRLHHARRDWAAADQQFHEADRALEELLALSPGEPEFLRSRAHVYQHWGAMQMEQDGVPRAHELFDQARRGWEAALAATSAAEYQNEAAAFLTECPAAELRDPPRALELAQQALQAAPANAQYLGTLGAAQYRAGDWQPARAALQQAVDDRAAIDGKARFFLAMTLQQLGESDEARANLEQGKTWRQQHRPGNLSLLRLEAEATAALQPAGQQ